MDPRKEKGFFGFIIDAQKDEALANAFKETKSLDDLKRFFMEDNPFYGLSEEELERIYAARDAMCAISSTEEVWDIICGGRGY
jgi:dihydroorotase